MDISQHTETISPAGIAELKYYCILSEFSRSSEPMPSDRGYEYIGIAGVVNLSVLTLIVRHIFNIFIEV